MTNNRIGSNSPNSLSRRDFLKASMIAGAAGLLAACKPSSPARSPTTPVPAASETNPTALKSKVIRAHHSGVWTGAPQGAIAEDNNLLSTVALDQMLDASITELTGITNPNEAWASLFDPAERVAIKVNTYGGSFNGSQVFTHAPLVMRVTERLKEVGIPAEQIVIYDCATSELEGGGYTVNQDGPGVRCHGSQESNQGTAPAPDDPGYVAGWQLVGRDIRLSRSLAECDALINMPVLKAHGITGITFALKNHYGSFDIPWDFHDTQIQAIPELNTLPEIKERTRLVIGDALAIATTPRASCPYFTLDVVGDSILMSRDPLAMDFTGLEILKQLCEEQGMSTGAVDWASVWIKHGGELGLGACDPANIELAELNIG